MKSFSSARRGPLFLVLLGLVLLTSCAKPKLKGPEKGPEAALSPSVSEAFVFPHSDGWGDPMGHGEFARTQGHTLCLKCHAVDVKEGEQAPSCRSCHVLFPHSSSFKSVSEHGSLVLEKGVKDCQTACHGTDLSGGLTGKACTSCHQDYPHVEDWISVSEHSKTALEKGIQNCQGCHDDDEALRSEQIPSCQKCHTLLIHPLPWAEPNQHGTFFLEKGRETCATNCHGADLNGGLTEKACTDCHKIFPHSAGWKDADKHGAAAIGDLKKDCTVCHGAAYDRELNGKSCHGCHDVQGGSFPHPDNWMTLPSPRPVRLKGGQVKLVASPSSHGLLAKSDMTQCQKCHGAKLDKFKDIGKDCASCHASLLEHNFTGLSSADWLGTEGHQKTKDKKPCQLCHGVTYEGGSSGVSCYQAQCHADYPHRPLVSSGVKKESKPWKDRSVHGVSVVENKYDGNLSECAKCHAGKTGEEDFKICKDCHQGKDYPHVSPTWVSKMEHGWHVESPSVGRDKCTACHGADGARRILGQSCQSCHDSVNSPYPHPANWAPSSSPVETGVYRPNKPPTGHGAIAKANSASCHSCHGDDLSRRLSGTRNCADCHPSYLKHERVDGTSYVAEHKPDLGIPYKESTEQCRLCHGFSYTGGLSKMSCYTCHKGYPHFADMRDPLVHGPIVGENGKATCAFAGGCHGSSFAGNPSTGAMSCRNSECHIDYPHTFRGGDYQHVARFIYSVEGVPTNNSSCAGCHGSNFNRGEYENKACNRCHHSGITHIVSENWLYGSGHGADYIGNTAEPSRRQDFCDSCHGSSYTFTNDQTPEQVAEWIGEAPARNCYGCHAAYPHVGYRHNGSPGGGNWREAHDVFVRYSPLLLDAEGHRPREGESLTAAIRHSCGGGTLGNCHNVVRNPPSNDYTRTLRSLNCQTYCHRPSWMP